MKYRNLRASGLIQEELGKILLREIEFPSSTLVTITQVEVDEDMREAKIVMGVIPDSSAKEVIDLLVKNRPFLQNLLLKKINIKPMPRIYFELEQPTPAPTEPTE